MLLRLRIYPKGTLSIYDFRVETERDVVSFPDLKRLLIDSVGPSVDISFKPASVIAAPIFAEIFRPDPVSTHFISEAERFDKDFNVAE